MALDTIPKQEGGKLKAVASGTLPSGQPVIVNSDGTVSVVAESTESADQSLGSATTFESANSQDMAATYDPDQDKVVIVYQDNTNSLYGTAIIGTVSGTSISFGTPTVFNSANTYQIATAYDANAQKTVVFYSDDGNSSYGTGIVGTVSGTSISFGSETVFESATTYWISCAYDANAQKTVVAYRDSGNSLYGTSIVATVSGTSISFGSPVVFNSGSTYETSATYDSTAQKVVISYADNNNSGRGTAIVGTVSGTSISFGSAGVFNSGRSEQSSIAYDANADKVVVAYRQDSNGYCLANVGTVSGTSISFGSSATVNAASSEYISTVYDSNAEKVVVCYRDNGNSDRGRFNVGTVSGTSISFAGEQLFEAGATWHIGSTYDSTAKRVIIVYGDEGDSYYGKAIVLQNAFSRTTSNLTSENYIGMSGGVVDVESGTQAIGSPEVFESVSSVEIGSAYDANAQRVVVAYRDGGNSNYGTAVIGTVSGTSISFGTPVVFLSAVARESSVVYDANAQKVVIAYKNDGNNESTAIVGTVSGTTISFGTAVVFGTAASNAFATTYDTNAQKVVIAYMTTNDNGIAIVGTVSGTSISFGSPTQLENSRNSELAITYDANAQKVVVAYKDLENSNYGTAVVGTVSGTSISFGTPAAFNTGTSNDNSIAYDANAQKVVISYVDGGNSNYGTAIVGTVSGTSISFGSAVVFESGGTVSYNSIVYDPTAKRVVNFYRGGSSAVGNVVVGNVSGTSISFDTPSQFESGAANHNSAVYDSNTQKVVVAYEDGGNSGYGTSVVFQTGYTNATRAEVADGDPATVDIVGTVSSNQVSLTAGQQYYVQTDGTIGTTPADPSVLAGTAVSATKMVVKS